MWPAYYCYRMLGSICDSVNVFIGAWLSTWLRDYYFVTSFWHPKSVVQLRLQTWVGMRKLQMQIYIIVQELWEMKFHLYDFYLFRYANTTIRCSQSAIDRARFLYLSQRRHRDTVQKSRMGAYLTVQREYNEGTWGKTKARL
jgi:hypothetical protein